MKVKNRFLLGVFLLFCAVCFIALSACDDGGGGGSGGETACVHQWGEWSVTASSTCVSEGSQERVCTLCGETETSTVAKTEHIPNPDDGDCTTALTCSKCGETVTAARPAHTGGVAACEQQAKCEVCGTGYGEVGQHRPNKDDGNCMTEVTCAICGEVTTAENEAHSGGIATCTSKAKCAVCKKEYGDPLGHTPNADDGDCTTAITCAHCNAVLTAGAKTHTGGVATCQSKPKCTKCGKEYGELAQHVASPDDGDCTTEVKCVVCETVVVPAYAEHTGGVATCQKRASCLLCGKEYGDFAPCVPNADDGDCTTAINCSLCGKVLTEANEGHLGGEATCKEKAKCASCGIVYGELGEHVPSADDGDCTTAINCSVCGELLDEGKDSHVGGVPTCEHRTECEICGKEYGDLAEHIPNADDGDCTTPITCSVCGEIVEEARSYHTGGVATCEVKASCEICGKEYGLLAEHTPNADDGDCTTEITCSVCGDVTTEGRDEHIGGTATCEDRAECKLCGMEYGDLADHIPCADDGDCTTEVTCWVCGEVTTEARAAHTGGTARCDKLAECAVCGKGYGELLAHTPYADDGDCTTEVTCSSCGHVTTPARPYHTGGTETCTHKAVCTLCGSEYGKILPHTPNADDGDCTTPITCSGCGTITTSARARHTGGHATCEYLAECDVCGSEYGEYAAHIPFADDGDCTTEVICSVCGDVTTPARPNHTGGHATCISFAECEVCGMEYGGFGDHDPFADDGDCTTEVYCSICGDITTEARPYHTGGIAGCDHFAECEACGKEYGELLDHTPNADDGDCTTAITCSVCGAVTTEARAHHVGGVATCDKLAECDVCGSEYGEFADHEGEIIWVKKLNTHHKVYSCCYAEVSAPEAHRMENGACTECGFRPSVSVTSDTVSPGDTMVEMSISISDNPGLIGLLITVEYDMDVLTLVDAENGDALSELAFTQSSSLDSGCRFLWDAMEISDAEIKDGEFLKLTFNVAADAPEGEYGIFLKITAYDNDLNPVDLSINGGKITVVNK